MKLVLAWLGMTGNPEHESLPLWTGVSERRKWGSLLICLGLAFLTFATTSWLIKGDSEDLFFLPWTLGAGVLLLGSLLAERALIQIPANSKESPTTES